MFIPACYNDELVRTTTAHTHEDSQEIFQMRRLPVNAVMTADPPRMSCPETMIAVTADTGQQLCPCVNDALLMGSTNVVTAGQGSRCMAAKNTRSEQSEVVSVL